MRAVSYSEGKVFTTNVEEPEGEGVLVRQILADMYSVSEHLVKVFVVRLLSRFRLRVVGLGEDDVVDKDGFKFTFNFGKALTG